MVFQEYIRMLRRESGKTLRRFCEDNKIDVTYMSKVERGIEPLLPRLYHEFEKMYGEKFEQVIECEEKYVEYVYRFRKKRIVSEQEVVGSLPVFHKDTEENIRKLAEHVRQELQQTLFPLYFYPEYGYVSYISDEEDIVHNHFVECPICNKEDTSTNRYWTMQELEIGERISCAECHAEFELVDNSGYCYADKDEIPWIFRLL